jgi:indolepyruvate ferredoxin oxidoreductase alpha subunit
LVILDNSTTAMTGNQPTPAGGRTLAGQPAPRVLLTDVVKACGVRFVEEGDPYQFKTFVGLLKQAGKFSRSPDGGVAVVIAKHPCLMDRSRQETFKRLPVVVNEKCEGCGFCIKQFECPALQAQGEKEPIVIDPILCAGCGVCVHICPHKALEVAEEGSY